MLVRCIHGASALLLSDLGLRAHLSCVILLAMFACMCIALGPPEYSGCMSFRNEKAYANEVGRQSSNNSIVDHKILSQLAGAP
jgi:hypothetical protein